jgi:hypothetical protein
MEIDWSDYFTEEEMSLINAIISNTCMRELFKNLLIEYGDSLGPSSTRTGRGKYGYLLYDSIYSRIIETKDEKELRHEIFMIFAAKFPGFRSRSDLDIILDDLCVKLLKFLEE